MRLASLVYLTSFAALAAGIAFSLYAPLMMNLYGILETGSASQAYWHTVSFARMFGAALFSFGILGLALRRVAQQTPLDSFAQRGLASAMLLAHLMGFVVATTQQVSIWGTLAGWITSGLLLLLTLAYAYILIKPAPS